MHGPLSDLDVRVNASGSFMVISIPFASLKAQNGMKSVSLEHFFYYRVTAWLYVSIAFPSTNKPCKAYLNECMDYLLEVSLNR